MPYCIYLRKSRIDMEAEAQDAGETLARHQNALIELAHRQNLSIEHIYKEIVSGDTIAARPQMQKLLADVEAGLWDGVLVMEIERLARGDTIDQGIVAQTFKYSDTRIITPAKTYDPHNDIDEEYFEFSLFMSRREYKTIKRRLNAGRLASAREGNYMAPKPTFGYDKQRMPGRGARWQLVVNPQQAPVVRQIFDLYENGMDGRRVGAQPIANRLNLLGFRTVDGNQFSPTHIRQILHNPVYTGCTTWNKRVSKSVMVNGQKVVKRIKSDKPVLVPGTHEAIIAQEQFDRVQELMLRRQNHTPVNTFAELRNPLAGLVVCSECGRVMTRKPDSAGLRQDSLCCPTNGCATSATYIHVVEAMIIRSLRQIATLGLTVNLDTNQVARRNSDLSILNSAQAQLEQLKQQRLRIHEFLERGIYTVETFVERNAEIADQIAAAESEIARLRQAMRRHTGYTPEQIARVTSFLESYRIDASVADKNSMLKSVIEKVTYHKTQRCFRNEPADSHLHVDILLRDV